MKAVLMFSARGGGFLLALVAGVLAIVLATGVAAAKMCGSGVVCACGDTVQGVAVLQSDLGVCQAHGLLMSTGSVLDCAGHTITGADPLTGEWYGIHLDTVSGAQVRNCHVTTFRRGLRVIGGGSHTLVGNELSRNKYGIDLAGQTAANRIEGNIIRDSRDEGIHVGTGASDNLIVGNQIINSKSENVYLLEASGTRVIGNVLVDAGNASVFIKHSTNSYVASNLVWDTGIELRGDSWGNILENNHLRGGDGFLFEAYQEDVWKYPHDNQVRGGTVFNAKPCVRMFGAHDNHVQGVTIDDDCGAIQEAPAGGLSPPFGNIFDLTVTEPGPAGARAAVQVTTSAREVHAGDVITLGLAVHNGPTNVPLDLYVGVLLPDNQIGFFASQGGFSTAPSAMVPLQPAAPSSFSLALPRFVEVALPGGTPPGTYQFFAAFLVPGALADGAVAAGELAAFALESFTVQP